MKTLGRSLGSLLAGPAAWLLTFPIDTLKTIIQADSLANPRWTVMNYLRYLRSTNNLRSLYNGLLSVVLRSGPLNLIFFNTWETVQELVLKLEDKYAN